MRSNTRLLHKYKPVVYQQLFKLSVQLFPEIYSSFDLFIHMYVNFTARVCLHTFYVSACIQSLCAPIHTRSRSSTFYTLFTLMRFMMRACTCVHSFMCVCVQSRPEWRLLIKEAIAAKVCLAINIGLSDSREESALLQPDVHCRNKH